MSAAGARLKQVNDRRKADSAKIKRAEQDYERRQAEAVRYQQADLRAAFLEREAQRTAAA